MKFRRLKHTLLVYGLTNIIACSGSSSGSSNYTNEATASRFNADNYQTDSVDNSSLTGSWLLTGSYAIEDTIDKTINEVVFREIVSIQQDDDGTIEIADCFEDIGGTDIEDTSDNQIEWPIGSRVVIKLSIANNRRLEGDIMGGDSVVFIVTSSDTATMVKIADQPTQLANNALDLGRVSMNVVGDGIENGALQFESEVDCFAEKQITFRQLEGTESIPGDLNLNQLLISSNNDLDHIYLDIVSDRTGSLAGTRDTIVDGSAFSDTASIRINYFPSDNAPPGFSNEVLSATVTYRVNSESNIRGSYTIDADDSTRGLLDVSGDFDIELDF